MTATGLETIVEWKRAWMNQDTKVTILQGRLKMTGDAESILYVSTTLSAIGSYPAAIQDS